MPATASNPISLAIAQVAPGRYRLQVHCTGFRRNDPLSAYTLSVQVPMNTNDAVLVTLEPASPL